MGRSAAYSGARTRPEMSEAGAQDVIAIGNLLATARVPAAMLRGFQLDPFAPLTERLMQALEAGLAAGGETTAVRSAHLLVVETQVFPLVDLRVDWDDAPVTTLRALWNCYAPEMGAYVMRALEPDHASPASS